MGSGRYRFPRNYFQHELDKRGGHFKFLNCRHISKSHYFRNMDFLIFPLFIDQYARAHRNKSTLFTVQENGLFIVGNISPRWVR